MLEPTSPTKNFARLGLANLLLGSLLFLPSACRDRYGQAMQPGPTQCQAIAWGGWNGTPECGGIAAIVIAAEQRMCGRNEDCAIVGQNRCTAHAVNSNGQASASAYPAPCLHPLSVACPTNTWTAVCEQGCCVPRPGR